MAKNATPKKGEFIKIVTRKCGGQQPNINVGDNFEVLKATRKKDVIFVEASCPKTQRKIVRINSSRFDWKVTSARELAEEQFKIECEQESRQIDRNFTNDEKVQIVIVPLIFYSLAWRCADKAIEESVAYRVDILKKATRKARETKEAYERTLRRDLDSFHLQNLKEECDNFAKACQSDLITLFFSINGELKKRYPNYPYDKLRSFALMSLFFINMVDAHNKKMDSLIRQRLGGCKDTIQPPTIRALKELMLAFAGVDEQFDFAGQNIALSRKIFTNNISRIQFDLTA